MLLLLQRSKTIFRKYYCFFYPCSPGGSNTRYEVINEAKRGMFYEIFDRENDVTYGTIFDDTFRDFFNTFDIRWWSFCQAFNRENYDQRLLKHVNDFRIEVMTLFNKKGGPEYPDVVYNN